MGMEKEIPTCGIFSELEDKENEELDDVPEMEDDGGHRAEGELQEHDGAQGGCRTGNPKVCGQGLCNREAVEVGPGYL